MFLILTQRKKNILPLIVKALLMRLKKPVNVF